MPFLLTQDTLNPSFYGMRIIATELEPLIDKLIKQVGHCVSVHGASCEVCMRQLHVPQSAACVIATYPLACTGADLGAATPTGSPLSTAVRCAEAGQGTKGSHTHQASPCG